MGFRNYLFGSAFSVLILLHSTTAAEKDSTYVSPERAELAIGGRASIPNKEKGFF